MSEKHYDLRDYQKYFNDDPKKDFQNAVKSLEGRIKGIQENFDIENYSPKKTLEYKVLNSLATTPKYSYPTDSGFDLCSVESVTIPPLSRAMIGTGIAFNLPDGTELQIRSRSGLAAKHGIMVLNSPGTIDCGYTGEVKIVLFNSSQEPFQVDRGMKIAQAVYTHCMNGKWVDLEEVDEIEKKDRNENGFGSTGI
jgi:dUTP pyrophosphatase